MSHREWCRVTVFVRGRGKKAKGYAYQLLNTSRRHERLRGSPAATRVAGTGSFYWPSAREAWRAAQVELRKPEVDSVQVETISGRKIGYASKHGSYAYTADDRDARRSSRDYDHYATPKVGDAVQFRWMPGTPGVVKRIVRGEATVATPHGTRKVPLDALRRVRAEHIERTRRAVSHDRRRARRRR